MEKAMEEKKTGLWQSIIAIFSRFFAMFSKKDEKQKVREKPKVEVKVEPSAPPPPISG